MYYAKKVIESMFSWTIRTLTTFSCVSETRFFEQGVLFLAGWKKKSHLIELRETGNGELFELMSEEKSDWKE